MSKDISRLVDGWPYEPGEVRARWIEADDGSRKLQLRLDLGIFQMEPTGRPDGTCPRGAISLRDFYIEEEMRSPDEKLPYKLDNDACAELQLEAMQYYYRIMAFYALGEHKSVVKDCEHNLDIIDIVSDYAADDETAWQFNQLFPYMRMMLARAVAEVAMSRDRFDRAARAVKDGIRQIEQFFAENYEPQNADGTPAPPPAEVISLRELLADIERRRPKSEAENLRAELARAVELENYEKAAFLRDQLKRLQGLATRPPDKKRSRSESKENRS
ncbi:MAG TPA: UvrB/UvrC motif-containing protein [Kiritimatiellia bacterium]|jgi:hypothetical protein|nr:UvrB/UvrC motif-containing protein [Kiritimatiellia bacterium]OQC60385.1 MAG: UvrB/uvrC motif protein [Verrucomicrobia bacterium ADurb.Bin018]HOD99932.1 UvrB/UvrC motif-containing protein [Kiritimatiellia bacterium]HOE37160.1 UvrB/UvrC motif-containing protein [Kiritimatiellia bacterium]HOR74572.1 UvrB/UvrC motif-containing protein [Kiritimatiellia bacterium]